MKVLFIHCTYKFKGGEDTVVSEEIKLLRGKGVNVQLLSFTNDENALANLLLLPFNIFSFYKTIKKIREFQPDLVHIHNFHFAASPAVIYAVKKMKLPLVMTLHNFRLICPSAILYHNGKLFLDSLEAGFPWKAVRRGVYKNSRVLSFWLAFSMHLHKRIGTWKKVDRFIVLSEHAFNVILKSNLNLTVQQLVIKPNFSSPPLLTTSVNPPYFLFVGRLSEEKGIRILLQAFSILNYKLKIAGDGPLLNEVQEATRECANIQYLGILDNDEINVLMANCTALVFPSTWYEAMPLTIIEAFACGAPVIASNLGAMENMITDGYNGVHFKSADLHELVMSVNRWMTFSDEEKNVFKVNARITYYKKYTPEKNADQLLRIYSGVSGIHFNGTSIQTSMNEVEENYIPEENAL